MDYRYRFLSNSLGRFISPDPIIPSLGNPQSLNRYSYTYNNPINYTDPTGHCPEGKMENCGNRGEALNLYASRYLDYQLGEYGIDLTISDPSELWLQEKSDLLDAARYSGKKFAGINGGSSKEAFREAHGDFNIHITGEGMDGGNCETIGNTITCTNAPNLANTLHEFAHVLDNNSGLMASDLDSYNSQGNPIDGGEGNPWVRGDEGFLCTNAYSCMEHPDRAGYGGLCDIPNSGECIKAKKIEQWADLYMNWILDGTGDPDHGFTNDAFGNGRRKYMDQQVDWLFQEEYLP